MTSAQPVMIIYDNMELYQLVSHTQILSPGSSFLPLVLPMTYLLYFITKIPLPSYNTAIHGCLIEIVTLFYSSCIFISLQLSRLNDLAPFFSFYFQLLWRVDLNT